MATTITLRNERFPQGTSVSVYPYGARLDARAPSGQKVAGPASVGADQTLTFTGLPDKTHLSAYALVNGEHRYVSFFTD
jgi:hypothetical protein